MRVIFRRNESQIHPLEVEMHCSAESAVQTFLAARARSEPRRPDSERHMASTKATYTPFIESIESTDPDGRSSWIYREL